MTAPATATARPDPQADGRPHDHTGHGGHAGGHDDHEHGRHPPPFRRLLGLLRPEAGDLWVVVLFAVGVGVLTLATPVVAMAVVNTVALGTLVQQLVVLCAALFAALLLAGFLQFLQTVVVEFVQRRVFVRVAADLAYRLPRVDLRAFDRQHGPELVNRFFDVLTVQKAAATLLLDGVTIALQVLIGLLLLGFYHVYLLGFDLILLSCLVLLFTVLGRGGVRTAVRESILKYAVAGWMEEVARHPVAFKSAGGPGLARDRTDALTLDYLTARAAHFRVLMRQVGFALLLQAVANVALLALGGWLVIEGKLTLGELVAAEIVVTLVVATFTKFGKQLEAYYDLLAAVDKLGHLLDLPLEREGGEPRPRRDGPAGVVVHDVTFAYDGGGRSALAGVSLRLAPGERVALTGPNGAGKSTLVDVLFGLRRPAGGWVEFDGADLRAVALATVRDQIAVVKGIEVFDGTVLENVRMGRAEVSMDDARDALRRVGLLEAIRDLPDGLATRLWTGGAPLSLGQANRLMIARGIAGRPRLLVLDEALDHMDTDIRETVLPALFGKDAPWTLLVVTHSDEAARLCDRVVRLEPPRHTDPTP
ncbi:MAG: ATP-binding cassette domain-containing protein [Gemmataceae bacterium]|nr:ATP-binding cassette domain-containing protein [Gemmataceae bacterium]